MKNELKILLFEREISIFDFDLKDFLDLSSNLDFGTIFRFGFGFGFGVSDAIPNHFLDYIMTDL